MSEWYDVRSPNGALYCAECRLPPVNMTLYAYPSGRWTIFSMGGETCINAGNAPDLEQAKRTARALAFQHLLAGLKELPAEPVKEDSPRVVLGMAARSNGAGLMFYSRPVKEGEDGPE